MGRRRDAGPAAGPRAVRTVASLPRTLPDPYEALGDSPNLIDTERADLAACEAAIDSLRVAFWAAGKALQVIRDARLYRATHHSFEEYCQDRWEMTRQQASRLILAWPLAERLSPIGDKINEGQVRELLPLASRHGQDAAVTVYGTVAEVVAQEDGGRVTAAVLSEVVKVLPADAWDPAEAVRQIREYLAGDGQDAQQDPPDPATAWAAEADRLRATVRKAVTRPSFRAALRDRPAEARAVVRELRELLDEIERETAAGDD